MSCLVGDSRWHILSWRGSIIMCTKGSSKVNAKYTHTKKVRQTGIQIKLLKYASNTWRKLGPLATHCAHSEDSDQTGRMPRLIWVFAGRTATLLYEPNTCVIDDHLSQLAHMHVWKTHLINEYLTIKTSSNFCHQSMIYNSVGKQSPWQLLFVYTSQINLTVRTEPKLGKYLGQFR